MAKNIRERAERYAKERDTRPHASAQYLRISPGKIRIILDLIRDKSYNDAVVILQSTNKSACPYILKVLNSAAANAENNLNMPKENLFVASCWVGQGPTLKRIMPRAKGSADRILKRTSHINIILDEKKEAVKVKKTPAKKAAPKVKSPAETPIAREPNTKKATWRKESYIEACGKEASS
jgi:large subunit ribosomal protein L22